MRMQKEEKIVVVLLLMALGSLAVAFWAFSPEDSFQDAAASSKKEASISIEGLVMDMKPTKTGGNLIIQLDSTPLEVFVSRDSGANEILNRIDLGDRIRIKGSLWGFNGKKEIKLERSGDLEKINPL